MVAAHPAVKVYVLTASPARGTTGYIAWGHSTIVGPWCALPQLLLSRGGLACNQTTCVVQG
jgi:hypothetical protein